MYIHPKTAAKLGQILARELHAHNNPETRGAILCVRSAILDELNDYWQARLQLNKAFDAELDILEPLSAQRVKGAA